MLRVLQPEQQGLDHELLMRHPFSHTRFQEYTKSSARETPSANIWRKELQTMLLTGCRKKYMKYDLKDISQSTTSLALLRNARILFISWPDGKYLRLCGSKDCVSRSALLCMQRQPLTICKRMDMAVFQ